MKIKLQEDAKVMTKVQVTKLLNDETLSKSNKMKTLFLNGHTIKGIAELMNVRYNFVYNVVSNMINVDGLEVESTKQDSKKDKIIEMFLAGNSNKEIQIELKANYNYVYNTIKKYKLDNPAWEANRVVNETVAE